MIITATAKNPPIIIIIDVRVKGKFLLSLLVNSNSKGINKPTPTWPNQNIVV